MLYLLWGQLLQPESSRGRLWPQIPGKQPHWTLVSVQPHHVVQVPAEALGHLQSRPAFTGQACVQIWKMISCPIFIKNKYLFKIKIPPEFVFSFLSFFSCQKAKGISPHTENHICPLFLLPRVSLGLFVNLEKQMSHKVKNKIFTYSLVHHLINKHLLCARHCTELRTLKWMTHSSCSQNSLI